MLPDMTPPGPCRLSPRHPVTPSRGQMANLDKALWLACSASPAFFLDRYGTLYDPQARGWTRFRLWPAQVAALEQLAAHRLAVVLKARQLGMSWLTVGFGLWQMLFRPAATSVSTVSRTSQYTSCRN